MSLYKFIIFYTNIVDIRLLIFFNEFAMKELRKEKHYITKII